MSRTKKEAYLNHLHNRSLPYQANFCIVQYFLDFVDLAIRREGYFVNKGRGKNYLHEHDDLLSCCLSPCLPDYWQMLRHDGPKEDGAIRLLFQVSDHVHVLAVGIPKLNEVLRGLRFDDLELNNRKHIGRQHL